MAIRSSEMPKEATERNTVCQCGGWLKSLLYQCDPMGNTSFVSVKGEKIRRELMVCENCGIVYAIPVTIEKDA